MPSIWLGHNWASYWVPSEAISIWIRIWGALKALLLGSLKKSLGLHWCLHHPKGVRERKSGVRSEQWTHCIPPNRDIKSILIFSIFKEWFYIQSQNNQEIYDNNIKASSENTSYIPLMPKFATFTIVTPETFAIWKKKFE